LKKLQRLGTVRRKEETMKRRIKKIIKRLLGIVFLSCIFQAWYFAECYGQLVDGYTIWDMMIPLGIAVSAAFALYVLQEVEQ
jgi:hypothetical protein